MKKKKRACQRKSRGVAKTFFFPAEETELEKKNSEKVSKVYVIIAVNEYVTSI